MDHQGREILLDDEPRFAGGAEIALAYAHLSLVFDKALRAYSLTCDDEDGEAVRLILEPSELERIARELLAAREWSRSAGGRSRSTLALRRPDGADPERSLTWFRV